MPYANTSSTVKLQTIINSTKAMNSLKPQLDVSGSFNSVAFAAANDTMDAIFAVPFPHKWAEMILPPFYTNSYQQDYVLLYPNGSSVTQLSWLERGTAIDINSTSTSKPYCIVETGRQLPQVTAMWFSYSSLGSGNCIPLVNFFPNSSLYYGTWGDGNIGNASFGNNPVAGSVYTSPLGPISQPANPITQIQDANGNLLVLTTYGTEGTTAPLAPVSAVPGTTFSGAGATTVWTVIDPNGQGIRMLPVPNQTGVVWQINLVGQMLPPRFTTTQQTLAPLPDQFETTFRQGFVAQMYRYSTDSKVRASFKQEWELWTASLVNLRAKQDRETEENRFTPEQGIMSRGGGRGGWAGGAWPFAGPAPGQGY